MSKKLNVLIVLCAVFSLFFIYTFSVYADGERKRFVLNGCESESDVYKANSATAVDDKNYVSGKSSLQVKSIIPSIYLDVRSETDTAYIPFANAYLEFYLFIDDVTHMDYYGAIVLSSESQPLSEATQENAQANSFVWTYDSFRNDLKSGWNYLALKLDEAVFNGSNPEGAYVNLKYLTTYEIAKTKPEFADADWETKVMQGGLYTLIIGIDEIAITDMPRLYGGENGGIEYTLQKRMSDIQYMGVELYNGGQDRVNMLNSVLLYGSIVLLITVAGIETTFIVAKIRRKK